MKGSSEHAPTGAENTDQSRKNIALATLVAILLAAAILTIFILPAEFNRDPTGIGETLGIRGLSEVGPTVGTLNKQSAGYQTDSVSFELLPYEFVEYKYRLEESGVVVYHWAASGPVSFDFHGEPEEGLDETEKSYSAGKGSEEKGAFTAPFGGIHGWYWANRGAETVTVEIKASGFFTASLEFRENDVSERVFAEAP